MVLRLPSRKLFGTTNPFKVQAGFYDVRGDNSRFRNQKTSSTVGTPDVKFLVARMPSQMNPKETAIFDPVLRQDAIVSSMLNFREVGRAPENDLNRILWRAMQDGRNL
jgi:hypothetical protein